ncbi:MAG: LamG-like jellyroll fold domain-containing protein, partial [Planctomycetota bacterium]
MGSKNHLFALTLLGIILVLGVGSAQGWQEATKPSPPVFSPVTPEYYEDKACIILDYTPGEGAITHTAYFSDNIDHVKDRDPAHCLGSVPPWPLHSPTAFVVGCDDPGIPEYARAPLVPGKTYYWCIDEFDGIDTWPGGVWNFIVVPQHASNPTPPEGAVGVEPEPSVTLSWDYIDLDAVGYSVKYDLYYGTSFAAVQAGTAEKVETDWQQTSVTVGPLAENTVYYWRIDAFVHQNHPPFGQNLFTDDIWQFTTGPDLTPSDSPVAHWKFDEGSGSVAYDSAGDNHGTIYGANWADGILGGALDFDGVDDYVEVPHDPSLDIPDQITIGAWIFQDFSADRILVCKSPTATYRDNYPGNYGLYIWEGGLLHFCHQTGTGSMEYTLYTSSGTAAPGQWRHVAVTLVEGETVQFYADGSSAGILPQSGSFGLVNSEPVRIATRKDTPSYFNGRMDDVRIYNRALSAAEVEELYGQGGEDGLVAHWKFDEGSGSIAYDSAGDNH